MRYLAQLLELEKQSEPPPVFSENAGGTTLKNLKNPEGGSNLGFLGTDSGTFEKIPDEQAQPVFSENTRGSTLKNLKNPGGGSNLGFLGTDPGDFEKKPTNPTAPRAYRWKVHTTLSAPVEVWLSPPGTAQDAMQQTKGAFLAEPDKWTVVGCATCSHLAKPGLVSPGYCAERRDQPPAYGEGHPLRKLPPDRGITCHLWERRE